MTQYQFLSDEWVAEARKIREEHDGAGSVPHKVRMNLVITEVPFGDAPVDAHMDTTTGEMRLDLGHLDDPDLKVTVDYATAKSILIEGNPQAGMQAFMAGKIKVEGDLSKLMALQAAPPDVNAQHIAQRLKDITA
ncbi:MAG: SCP2 sterol-binding domain-containing protein [Actinomycetota bacterium]|jgi:putative sterol carrier protein|nr:SCP2 sterol-binding domain-containing protein [Actinomycetota bacterium]MDA8279520.1 SCP2 sterol-binding domain-containing protein [Actinomycetota bacterium]